MAFLAAALVLVGCLAVAAAWDIGRRVVATKRTPALMELREEMTAKIEDALSSLDSRDERLVTLIDAVKLTAEGCEEELRTAKLGRIGGRR